MEPLSPKQSTLCPLTIRPTHPRLMATPDIVADAKRRVLADPLGRSWERAVYRQAEALLGRDPAINAASPLPVRARLEDPAVIGKTLLANVQLLGLAYLWWGEVPFAERAKAELLAAAALPDWGTAAQFLDVAETAHAFAIGFDWLYDHFADDERRIVAEALAAKALRPGLEAIRSGVLWAEAPEGWNLNWILVCNAGLALGALGISEISPELCAEVLAATLRLVPKGFPSFAPDGGWAEGPGYWHYASAYAVYLLAALETACGTDLGLLAAPGFAVTGDFRLHVEGPTGQLFNFADGDPTHSGLPWILWLDRRVRRPIDAWIERTKAHSPYPLDLLWFSSDALSPAAARTPLDRHFRSVEVATMRGAWEDPRATYVAVKGGSNRISDHCHLDLGSFVLDAAGRRFAVDLGEDDYRLPGYFDRTRRFDYYRTGSIGHNVVVVDGQNQRPEATAGILAFVAEPDRSGTVVDLGKAYQDCAWRRAVWLLDRRHALIVDDLRPFTRIQPTWQMHTPASVSLDGPRALLTIGSARLRLRLLAPAAAAFSIQSCRPPPPQNPNQGVVKLVVALPTSTADARIAVALSPDAGWIERTDSALLQSLDGAGGQ